MPESLLPPNATAQELALEQTAARLEEIPAPLDLLWNPESCPLALLPWLAWAFSVDDWQSAWSEATKRKVVARAIQVHRSKGTPGALSAALRAVCADAAFEEWFEYAGEPYHFRVTVSLTARGLSAQEQQKLEAVALSAKNVRSILERLEIYLTSQGKTPRFAARAVMGEVIRLFPQIVTEVTRQASLPRLALGHYGLETIAIYPH